VTQRSDRSGIQCNCKMCKAMPLKTNSKTVCSNMSPGKQERKSWIYQPLITNNKPHAIVHKITVTSRGIRSDMFISGKEVSKVCIMEDKNEISVRISCSCSSMMLANSNWNGTDNVYQAGPIKGN